MKVELKNFKSHDRLSEETNAFTANLHIDGKRVGECSNRGHGEPILFHFNDRATEQAFYDYCKSLPPVKSGYDKLGDLKMDADLYIGMMVEELLRNKDKERIEKQMRRWCAKDTMFRLKGDKNGAWRAIRPRSGPAFTPAIRAQLVNKYGDQLEEILNERY